MVRTPKHPDREVELEVRVRDRDVLVEDALDRLLRPRAVLSCPHSQRPVCLLRSTMRHKGG